MYDSRKLSKSYKIGVEMERIARVRSKGQLTVPAEVRQALHWPDEEVLVRVVPLPDQDGFRVERIPISDKSATKRKLTREEWEEIWQGMKRISRLGRAVNLSEFVAKDRESH